MQMTEKEIVAKYTQNEDKERYIEILADLNGVTVKEIKSILKANEVELPESAKPKANVKKVVKSPKPLKPTQVNDILREAKLDDEINDVKVNSTEDIDLVSANATAEQVHSIHVPAAVKSILEDEMKSLQIQIDALAKRLDEISTFLTDLDKLSDN